MDLMGAGASAPQVDMDSLDSAVKAVQMLCSKMPDFTIIPKIKEVEEEYKNVSAASLQKIYEKEVNDTPLE